MAVLPQEINKNVTDIREALSEISTYLSDMRIAINQLGYRLDELEEKTEGGN